MKVSWATISPSAELVEFYTYKVYAQNLNSLKNEVLSVPASVLPLNQEIASVTFYGLHHNTRHAFWIVPFVRQQYSTQEGQISHRIIEKTKCTGRFFVIFICTGGIVRSPFYFSINNRDV